MEIPERFGKQTLFVSSDKADGNGAGNSLRRRSGQLYGFLRPGQYYPRLIHEYPARRRQLHIPYKKSGPDSFFQSPDLLRHSRLGYKTFFCRLRKIQGFCHGHEIFQLFQVHPFPSISLKTVFVVSSNSVISFTYCNMQSSYLQLPIFYSIILFINYTALQAAIYSNPAMPG